MGCRPTGTITLIVPDIATPCLVSLPHEQVAPMNSTTSLFSSQMIGDNCIVRFNQMQIDPANCDAVFDQLLHFIESTQPRHLVLNMRKVDFLHSVAIGCLLQTMRAVLSYGGVLVFFSLEVQARETLAITHIDRLFDIRDSERAALTVA